MPSPRARISSASPVVASPARQQLRGLIPRLTPRLIPALFAFLIASVPLGCSGPRIESDLQIKGAPDWVNEGTAMFRDRKGRLFHGVGSAPPMGDLSLQAETADNRARAELARALTTYLEVVSSDYSAAAGGRSEGSVTRQLEAVTRLNLAGSRIVARWRDKRSGVLYSLAELDLRRVRATVRAMEDMDPGFRAHLERAGANLFDALVERKNGDGGT